MSTLDCGVDVLVTIGAARDHRNVGLVIFREARVRLVRPLHRRRAQLRSGSLDRRPSQFVAVADNWRTGQREHQAVSEFHSPPVAVEHGREPPANAPVIELHVRDPARTPQTLAAAALW